eukprot:TRINITY_DN7650_c0_g3_i1.p1 TRINITY_DN7650_c0_g3~~TRINITY_DN7650_c0_g3_i1.p1  ORF type:complete len:181 (-),score=14.66 TRINITY_DN7650_c0_g3_i1:144-686(-)
MVAKKTTQRVNTAVKKLNTNTWNQSMASITTVLNPNEEVKGKLGEDAELVLYLHDKRISDQEHTKQKVPEFSVRKAKNYQRFQEHTEQTLKAAVERLDKMEVRLHFVWGNTREESSFTLMTKGIKLIKWIYQRFNIPAEKAIAVKIGSQRASLLKVDDIIYKSLRDLDIEQDSTIYISVI